MTRGVPFVRAFVGGGIMCAAAWAQIPAVISLTQAQQTALRNHPRIASAALIAEASRAAVSEVRSAYYPTLSGNITGVGSEHNSYSIGGLRHDVKHLQSRRVGRGCESTPDRLRPHIQP